MQQVLGSLHKVVDLVVSRILDNDTIVEVHVVVEAKDIHGAIVN